MEPKTPPLGPVTPSNKFNSSLNLDRLNINAVNTNMARRNNSTPKVTAEQFRSRLPRIQEASRRLQNEIEVRNEDFWPVPSKAGSEINPIIYAVNAAILGDAIKDCGNFCVDMNRVSERGEIIDGVVKRNEKRKIKTKIVSEREVEMTEGETKGKKRNKKKKSKGKQKEVEQNDWEVVTIGEQNTPMCMVQETPDMEQGTSRLTGERTKAGNEVCSTTISHPTRRLTQLET